jgi:hypothetical protein
MRVFVWFRELWSRFWDGDRLFGTENLDDLDDDDFEEYLLFLASDYDPWESLRLLALILYVLIMAGCLLVIGVYLRDWIIAWLLS